MAERGERVEIYPAFLMHSRFSLSLSLSFTLCLILSRSLGFSSCSIRWRRERVGNVYVAVDGAESARLFMLCKFSFFLSFFLVAFRKVERLLSRALQGNFVPLRPTAKTRQQSYKNYIKNHRQFLNNNEK